MIKFTNLQIYQLYEIISFQIIHKSISYKQINPLSWRIICLWIQKIL